MESIPGALFIVDTRDEEIAVAEARKKGVPVIALNGSDCDTSSITKAIFANDASKKSIEFFVNEVAESYKSSYIPAPRREEKRESPYADSPRTRSPRERA
jgi:small subunit ribosomal protein S2